MKYGSYLFVFRVLPGTGVDQPMKQTRWAIDSLFGRNHFEDGRTRSTTFFVRWWLIVILTAILPVARFGPLVWRQWRSEHAEGLCPNCGYDLRATPERCPECGKIPTK